MKVVKTIPTPGHPHHTEVRLGRHRPVAEGPHLRLGNYLRASLPPAPASCDFSAKAASVLANIYGNDQLGDCVIAGGHHVVGTETGNADRLFTATQAQIIAQYSAIGGYVPGDPSTDNGCNVVDALNYWCTHGFADGTKALGWLAVDATNKAEVQAAMFLFENLVFGIELPDPYVNPFPSGNGFTWGVAGSPDPNNGHCIVGVGYNADGVIVDTWGMLGTFTFDAIAAYCKQSAGGELYVLLTPDQIAKGQSKAPNGVDWTSIIADFDSLGGKVPVPAPAPAPAPTPTPTPPAPTPTPTPAVVTLAMADSWLDSGFHNAHSVLTRTQALLIAKSALAKHWPK